MNAFEVSHLTGAVSVTVLSINEHVNMSNSGELEELARQEFEKGMRNLLIDLSNMPSITSAGLRVIIVIYKMLMNKPPAGSTANGEDWRLAHLKLLCPSSDVRRVLEIAGMADRLKIYDDLETAVASFH